jgi:hypothetical protein
MKVLLLVTTLLWTGMMAAQSAAQGPLNEISTTPDQNQQMTGTTGSSTGTTGGIGPSGHAGVNVISTSPDQNQQITGTSGSTNGTVVEQTSPLGAVASPVRSANQQSLGINAGNTPQNATSAVQASGTASSAGTNAPPRASNKANLKSKTTRP